MIRIFLVVIFLSLPAVAQETTCKALGPLVTCQREGFDKLVRGYIDQKAKADLCELDLSKAQTEARFQQNKARMVALTAIVGSVLIGTAFIQSLGLETRALSGASGAGLVISSIAIAW